MCILKYKNIKLSGEKLRISYEDTCLSFDLNVFPMFKVEKNKKNISFFEGETILDKISFSTVEEADKYYNIISKKVFKKNKRFRATVFVAKSLVYVFIAYIFINFLSLRAEQSMINDYQRQVMNQSINDLNSNDIEESSVQKATGNAVSVEDVFKLK